jgi:hypothetical protein
LRRGVLKLRGATGAENQNGDLPHGSSSIVIVSARVFYRIAASGNGVSGDQ